MKNVSVSVDVEEEEVWSIHANVACEKIPLESQGNAMYLCYAMRSMGPIVLTRFRFHANCSSPLMMLTNRRVK